MNFDNLAELALLEGQTVVVELASATATDPFGNPVKTFETLEVENVLAQPVSTDDLGPERPNGITIDVRFFFPKTFDRDLTGARITWGGHTFNVLGTPLQLPPDLTPGIWGLKAEGAKTDG